MRTISMTGMKRLFGGVLCVAVLAALLHGTALAQGTIAGKIKAIESSNPAEAVKVVRPGFKGILQGKPGDTVFVGDTVKTAPGALASVELSEGTVLVLGQNAAVRIKGYQVDPAKGKRNVVMNTLKGSVRFTVTKPFNPHAAAGQAMSWEASADSSVTVETADCVAAVRGTDFVVSVSRGATEVAVLEGLVSVRGANPSLPGEVSVGASQSSMVKKGGVPSQPAGLSAEVSAALAGATTLKNPRTSLPAAEGEKKSTGYDKKDLVRELIIGKPMGEVFDTAVANGIPIGDAVCTSITDANMDPKTVVYTATAEGYPVNTVVQSSVNCGAPVNGAVASALAAGGEKTLIIAGAQDAGIPNSAIANAFAAAGFPATIVAEGGGEAGAVTTAVTIPAPPTQIGGGGGAPASTKTASPYRP